jgi:hypothetical protein
MFDNLVQTMDTASNINIPGLESERKTKVKVRISQYAPPHETYELATSVREFKKRSEL